MKLLAAFLTFFAATAFAADPATLNVVIEVQMVAIPRATALPLASAQGHFVHVYVDRQTRRPVPLPERLVAFVKALQ